MSQDGSDGIEQRLGGAKVCSRGLFRRASETDEQQLGLPKSQIGIAREVTQSFLDQSQS